jgi:ABC-2 type transport system ATP-binding protein
MPDSIVPPHLLITQGRVSVLTIGNRLGRVRGSSALGSPRMMGTPASGAPALQVRSLHKSYGDVVAVDGLEFDVRVGECFGLLGPNGAGKTTTVEICEGLTVPDSGEVVVLGRRWGKDERELRELLGISLQETQFAEKLTVHETVRLFRSFYRHGPEPREVIGMVQLQEKASARVGQLSGGQRQRMALACALVGDPQLLFLDEPTTGLDPQSRRQLWELIERFKSEGRSILLTTHYMEEAERLCDQVAIVDHGRFLAQGTPRDLVASVTVKHVLEFALADRQVLPEATLAALDGVSVAYQADGTYRLQVAELHRTLPVLLGELRRHGVGLSELRTHSPTLEDVFVTITGRQLRDG